ncbi:MAG TPA: methyltransferase domain-containing protein [Myxococcota bacterium]|nr:methyltransferase domain-containing protein [Myxococcota bacterium]
MPAGAASRNDPHMKSLRRSTLQRNVDPSPPDWRAAFGRTAPIEVDLGCGRGDYAWQAAVIRPGINVVALDSRKKWIEHLRDRCSAEDLGNLLAIRCDILEDLPILFRRGSINAFTIHHPDPWWKKRHRKRRLIQPAMIEQLASFLVEGGWIYLQTDVPDLAAEIRALFSNSESFDEIDALQVHDEWMGCLRSHREKKCIELGIPFTSMAYVLADNKRLER